MTITLQIEGKPDRQIRRAVAKRCGKPRLASEADVREYFEEALENALMALYEEDAR